MSEETAVRVKVDQLFWCAIEDEDYKLAGAILSDNLEETSYAAAERSEDDSTLGKYLAGFRVDTVFWEGEEVSGLIIGAVGESVVKIPFYLDVLAHEVEIDFPSGT